MCEHTEWWHKVSQLWSIHLSHKRKGVNNVDHNVCVDVNPGCFTPMTQRSTPFPWVTVSFHTCGNTDLCCLHLMTTSATTIFSQIISILMAYYKLVIQLWVCMTLIYHRHLLYSRAHTALKHLSVCKFCICVRWVWFYVVSSHVPVSWHGI